MGMNLASISTSIAAATGYTGATLSATITCGNGEHLQFVSADGSAVDQNFKLTVAFGAVTRFTKYGLADTDAGWDFGDNGPVAAVNTNITVTLTPEATGVANAVNLVCEKIL